MQLHIDQFPTWLTALIADALARKLARLQFSQMSDGDRVTRVASGSSMLGSRQVWTV